MISPPFLLTALVVVLMPGTGVIYTVSCGLLRGRRAAIVAAAARRRVLESPAVLRWMKRGFAGLFAVLGVRLALSKG